MKKIILTALAIATVSCTGNDEIRLSSKTGDVFTATMEQADTKVYVDGNLNTLWNKDDTISIFTTTYNAKYRFTGQTGDAEGTFEEMETSFYTGQNVPTNYAVYPYMKGTTVSTAGILTVDIPAVQHYSEDSFGPGAGVMVAATQNPTSRFLQFKNLCGFLVFSFYGSETVKSITLTGNNNEKISGSGTVSPEFGEDPSLTMSGTGTESITLDCGAGVVLGTTAETATSFWMAVPPVTFENGFTVTVTNTEGGSMVRHVSSSRTVTRNVRNTMSALKVECADYVYLKGSNFKAYCVENFDTDGDGEISFDEAKVPTSMTFCTDDITDITGIKAFVNLRSLDASGSGARFILAGGGGGSSSGNTEGLDWDKTGLQAKGHLRSADLSGMTKLQSICIERNCLESLNIEGCTDLNYVSIEYNKLTSIDFSSLTGLRSLYCGCGSLSALDVSNNTSLKWLDCTNNPSLSEIWLKTGQTITEFYYDSSISEIKYKN